MLLDTSALVAWIGDEPAADRVAEAAGDGPYHICPIQYGELCDAARRQNRNPDAFLQHMDVMTVIPLTPDIAIEGARIKAEARKRPQSRDFSLIDGILLASARAVGVKLLTLDGDFEGLGDCVVV